MAFLAPVMHPLPGQGFDAGTLVADQFANAARRYPCRKQSMVVCRQKREEKPL
jgi:hypothetical protein